MGNDGRLYTNRSDKNRVFRWVLVKPVARAQAAAQAKPVAQVQSAPRSAYVSEARDKARTASDQAAAKADAAVEAAEAAAKAGSPDAAKLAKIAQQAEKEYLEKRRAQLKILNEEGWSKIPTTRENPKDLELVKMAPTFFKTHDISKQYYLKNAVEKNYTNFVHWLLQQKNIIIDEYVCTLLEDANVNDEIKAALRKDPRVQQQQKDLELVKMAPNFFKTRDISEQYYLKNAVEKNYTNFVKWLLQQKNIKIDAYIYTLLDDANVNDDIKAALRNDARVQGLAPVPARVTFAAPVAPVPPASAAAADSAYKYVQEKDRDVLAEEDTEFSKLVPDDDDSQISNYIVKFHLKGANESRVQNIMKNFENVEEYISSLFPCAMKVVGSKDHDITLAVSSTWNSDGVKYIFDVLNQKLLKYVDHPVGDKFHDIFRHFIDRKVVNNHVVATVLLFDNVRVSAHEE